MPPTFVDNRQDILYHEYATVINDGIPDQEGWYTVVENKIYWTPNISGFFNILGQSAYILTFKKLQHNLFYDYC